MMSPSSASPMVQCEQPMSRTYQYRKVMKPLLERKRRARINRCLDELKELMVSCLQNEGENVAKLEKADVLELTVKYLRKLKTQNRLGAVDMGPIHPSSSSPVPCPEAADRFKAGFTQCATEVGKCLSTIPGVDVTFGTRLMTYLGHCVNRLEPNTEVPRVPPTMDAPPPPKCPDTPPMSPPAGTAVDLALAAANYRHQLHLHRGRFPVLPHQVSPQSYLLAPAVPMTVDTDDESSEKVWRPW